MTMGQKRILAEHIKSVKHSFEAWVAEIEESSSLIESSATDTAKDALIKTIGGRFS